MYPKDAAEIANSVDPDQTPLGAVWSESALFAQTCLSKNYGIMVIVFIFRINGQEEVIRHCFDGSVD